MSALQIDGAYGRRTLVVSARLFFPILSLLTAGCRSTRPSGKQAEATATGPGDAIRLVHHIDWYEKAIDAAIQEYSAKHPRAPARQQIMPTSGLEMFFRTQLVAKQAPELMGNQEYKRFGRMGLLMNWQPILDRPNPYINRNKPWRAYFPDAALTNVLSLDGAIYGLPYERTDIGFIYNKQIFAKLGIKPPCTWAEWMESCRKIKAAGYVPIAWDGQYGMGSAWFIRTFYFMAQSSFKSNREMREHFWTPAREARWDNYSHAFQRMIYDYRALSDPKAKKNPSPLLNTLWVASVIELPYEAPGSQLTIDMARVIPDPIDTIIAIGLEPQ